MWKTFKVTFTTKSSRSACYVFCSATESESAKRRIQWYFWCLFGTPERWFILPCIYIKLDNSMENISFFPLVGCPSCLFYYIWGKMVAHTIIEMLHCMQDFITVHLRENFSSSYWLHTTCVAAYLVFSLFGKYVHIDLNRFISELWSIQGLLFQFGWWWLIMFFCSCFNQV